MTISVPLAQRQSAQSNQDRRGKIWDWEITSDRHRDAEAARHYDKGVWPRAKTRRPTGPQITPGRKWSHRGRPRCRGCISSHKDYPPRPDSTVYRAASLCACKRTGVKALTSRSADCLHLGHESCPTRKARSRRQQEHRDERGSVEVKFFLRRCTTNSRPDLGGSTVQRFGSTFSI